jgi:hypothetical protein
MGFAFSPEAALVLLDEIERLGTPSNALEAA